MILSTCSNNNNMLSARGAAPDRRTPCAWAPVPSGVPGPRSRGCSPLLGDCYGMQGGAQCAWFEFMCYLLCTCCTVRMYEVSVVYMVHCDIAVVHAQTPIHATLEQESGSTLHCTGIKSSATLSAIATKHPSITILSGETR